MLRTDLHNYQLASVDHIIEKTHSALFLEMGLGKTVSTLTAIEWLIYQNLEINNVLVVAPKRVADSVWDEEIAKWEHLRKLKISKIQGTAKQRKQALQTKADVYTIGRDNIAWLCGQYGGQRLPFDMLVIDELSSFKNPKSVRFKALKMVQPCFKRIVGLTGTPAPNGLIDLWAQIYLLDRGERLGKFISHYRESYFKPGQSNGAIIYNYKLLKDSEKRIHDKIKDICISMKAKDYLELPGRIENIVKVKFDEELQKKYDEFEKEQVCTMFANLPQEKEISAVNAAVLTNKLLQFANGFLYDESKKVHHIHDLKIDALKEIIEDANGKPVLIAWTYQADRDRMMEALKKYKPRELKTDKDIKEWNRGEVQVMMMHPASGGHGLNLQAGGNIIVWFGQNWSLELNQQFNARLDRQGQKNAVIIHKLVAEKSEDMNVIAALKNKDARQNHLMESVKAKIKKYVG